MSLWWAVLVLVVLGAIAGVAGETWLMVGSLWLIIVLALVQLLGRAGRGVSKAGGVVSEALAKEKEDVEAAVPKTPGMAIIADHSRTIGKISADTLMTTAEQRAQVPSRKTGEKIQAGSKRFLDELFRLLKGE